MIFDLSVEDGISGGLDHFQIIKVGNIEVSNVPVQRQLQHIKMQAITIIEQGRLWLALEIHISSQLKLM